MIKQRKSQHIQNRFIVFFILVSLPPLIFLGLVASWSVATTRAVNVFELESQLTQSIANQTKKFIEDSVEAIELHVPDQTIGDIALVPPEQLRILLQQFMAAAEFANTQEITVVSTAGQEIQKLRRDFRPAAPSASSIAETEKFKVAVLQGRYFSPVYFLDDGTPMMTLAARILNGSGFLIGVFTAEMQLSFIQDEIVNDVALGDRGYVYLVDEEGRMIGHSRDAKSVGETRALASFFPASFADLPLTELVGNKRYRNEAGEPVFASMRFIPKVHIAVVAEWPEQDALQVVRTIQKQIAVFALSTFGLILLASLFLARQVTKPIAILRAGAAVIGGGTFEHRIALRRHDELGELAQSFNDMAVQLKQLDELKAIQIRSAALAESLKKEQELSRQKDVFISVMSHQLRTPLTAMQWNMEYLFEETKKPELATYADSINDAAESSKQITAIVDDLLTVSELGIGYTVKKTEAVDVSALIKELQSALGRLMQEKKLTCTLQLPEAPLLVDANSNDMRKVFMNLLDNAITYTKAGGITVSGNDEGESIALAIADTGIGIAANEQKDIFREFFRATNAIVGKNVGTGLGLFIVKTIVQGHGGTVSFVSEENKGTTFTVVLPKKQRQKEEKAV